MACKFNFNSNEYCSGVVGHERSDVVRLKFHRKLEYFLVVSINIDQAKGSVHAGQQK